MSEDTTVKVTYLKDYLPAEYLIDNVELDINLTTNLTTVKSLLTVSKNALSNVNSGQLQLNGESLVLKEVRIDNQIIAVADYVVTQDSLIIKNVPNSFILQTIVEIKPQDNTALSGLYKSKDIYCTQCEAEGFRRITYYLDRPDVMATFKVTIHADKKQYPVLLANGNLVASGEDGSARHYATWQDPFKKPAYLFAMVAGDLIAVEDHFTTMSGRLVKLKLFVERMNLEQSAYALTALKKAMHWDEVTYGREYDLDIYMIVAVNDFNMGAMENKGLNIFNAKYILVSPATATDSDYANVDIVVAHEYFHNWSGNRVTCRDWFQLSLKEGFTVFREQQFTQDITQSPVIRIAEVKGLITRQFVEDAGPLAHPVRPDSYIQINNFYTMTIYEKGAEVIRMLYTLLGPQKFRAGTDLYFSRFDGHAVTTDDFVGALQEASGINLSQFKLWYVQSGTPEITVSEKYDAVSKVYTLILSQHTPDTPGQTNKQALHIPVAIGLLDDNGNDLPITTPVLSFSQAQQEFSFNNIPMRPHLSILRGFSAPVKLKRVVSEEELAFLAVKDSDDFNRWQALQQLYLNILLALISDAQQGKDLILPPILRDTFAFILLDMQINVALKAELLILPHTDLLIEAMQPADPDLIYIVKKFVTTSLAQTLDKDLRAMYAKYTVFGAYKYDAMDVALRACRNVILGYLASTKTEHVINLAQEQYDNANNMTDKIAALACLASINCNQRIESLIDFYNVWSTNPLVVNKWFMLQATADLDDVLIQVQSLMHHAAFDIKNPNVVHALIGGFCFANPVKFHARNGSGYKFLADTVLELDILNPQVAARMLAPLTQWRKFEDVRQKLMHKELLRIKNAPNLSNDVQEIILKALDLR